MQKRLKYLQWFNLPRRQNEIFHSFEMCMCVFTGDQYKIVANRANEILEGKIVENKKTKFSYAKQIFFTFFRNTNK